LSGNPLAMAAGLTMLKSLNNDKKVFDRLAAKTAYLHAGLEKVLQENNIAFTINNRLYDIYSF
jgi:glutamate-1-semialdehyde 2,1-aminomutase